MTERKVKLDRANKSILLRALGDVYYGQRAHGGSTEVTGRLILRVNDLPAGGKLTLTAAEYRLAKAALNRQIGGYPKVVETYLNTKDVEAAQKELEIGRASCRERV